MASSPKKKLLIVSCVVIVLIGVLIAIAPTVLGPTLAPSILRSALAPHVEGDVDVDQVRLGWFGEQRINELAITERNGREAVSANAVLHHGLLRTLLARPAVLNVTIACTMRGELHEDGTLSLQDLVRTDPDPDKPFDLSGVPGLHITLENSIVELLIAATGEMLTLRDTTGVLQYQPGHPVSLDLRSTTESVGTTGSFTATAKAENVVDARGRFTPRGAMVDSKIELASLPLKAGAYDGMLHELTITAQADDLAELLQFRVNADAVLQGLASGEADVVDLCDGPSQLTGEVQLASLFADDGAVTFGLEHVSGTVNGHCFPSAALQPMFAATPVVVSRDAGPVVDVNADFAAGPQIRADLNVKGEDADLELRATLNRDDGSWDGEYLKLTMPRAHPRLIEGYTTLKPDRPMDMEIELTHFYLPPVDAAQNKRLISNYAATGHVRVHQPVTLTLPEAGDGGGPELTVNLEQLDLNFESPGLGEWVTVSGGARADGGSFSLDQRLTNLFDESGEIAAETLFAEGTLTARDWPIAPIVRFMPDYEQLALEAIGETITIDLETSRSSDSLRAAIDVSSPRTSLDVVAYRRANGLEIERAAASSTITPRMLALLPLEADLPVTLVRDAPVRISLGEPVTFPRTGPLQYDLMPDRLVARLESDDLSVDDVPGLREPAALRTLRADVTATRSDTWTLNAKGNTDVFRVQGNHRVMQAAFDVSTSHVESQGGARPYYATRYSLDASNVAVSHLEALSEWGGAEWAMLAGQSGRFSITGELQMDTQTAAVDMDFDRLKGKANASLDPQRMRVESPGIDLTIAAAWLEPFLNQTGGDGSQEAGGLPGRVTVTNDLPLSLRVAQFALPRNSDGDKPFAVSRGAIDATVTTGALATRIGGDLPSQVRDITATVQSDQIGRLANFSMQGETRAGSGQQVRTGTININGNISDLLGPDELPDWNTARITANGTVESAPTVLADALLNMRGYLLSAVGPAMSSTINARNFSANSGSIELDIETTYGRLRAEGEGRDGVLVITESLPVTAQLEVNPLLRDKVLPGIHPLLGDIVRSTKPLDFTMSNARVPLDGDIGRLNADLSLVIGDVELDRASRLFNVLSAVQRAGGATVAGSIDPIVAKVRDGVVTYDQFIARVVGIEMPYEGRINLNDQSVQLRTSVPFGALAQAAIPGGVRDQAIGRYSDVLADISVPIITTGKIGALETRADPQFEMQRIIGQLIQQAIRDQLTGGQRGNENDEEKDSPLPFPFPFPFPNR